MNTFFTDIKESIKKAPKVAKNTLKLIPILLAISGYTYGQSDTTSLEIKRQEYFTKLENMGRPNDIINCIDKWQPQIYTLEDSSQALHIPKTQETNALANLPGIKERFGEGFSVMDIQYSEFEGCVPEIFMISELNETNKGVLSTGHISCFYVLIKDKQNRHIVCHIDAKRISQSKELTEQLQKTLQSRLQDFGEDTKDLKMYVGGSNMDSTSHANGTYQSGYEFVESIIKVASVNAQKNILERINITGPAPQIGISPKIMFELGGPDKVITQDYFFDPISGRFIVMRAITPSTKIYDEPNDVENRQKEAQKYYEEGGDPNTFDFSVCDDEEE